MHRTETLRYNWGAKVTTGTPSYLDQGPQGRECEDKTRDQQDYPVKNYQGLQDRKVESSTYYPTTPPPPRHRQIRTGFSRRGFGLQMTICKIGPRKGARSTRAVKTSANLAFAAPPPVPAAATETTKNILGHGRTSKIGWQWRTYSRNPWKSFGHQGGVHHANNIGSLKGGGGCLSHRQSPWAHWQ